MLFTSYSVQFITIAVIVVTSTFILQTINSRTKNPQFPFILFNPLPLFFNVRHLNHFFRSGFHLKNQIKPKNQTKSKLKKITQNLFYLLQFNILTITSSSTIFQAS